MSADNLTPAQEKEFCLFFVPLASPKPSAKLHNPSNFVGEAIFRTEIHRKGKGKKNSRPLFWVSGQILKSKISVEKNTALLLSQAGFLLFQVDSRPHLFLSLPPVLDDSIWQELLIKKGIKKSRLPLCYPSKPLWGYDVLCSAIPVQHRVQT